MSYTPSHLNFYLLSLAEPMTYVRNCYRDYVLAVMNRYPGHGTQRFRTWTYEPLDYFEALIKEIDAMDSRSLQVGHTVGSTQLLINQGFEATAAVEIAAVVFRMVLDLIVQHFPQATFDNTGRWSYSFVNGMDLHLCHNEHFDQPA